LCAAACPAPLAPPPRAPPLSGLLAPPPASLLGGEREGERDCELEGADEPACGGERERPPPRPLLRPLLRPACVDGCCCFTDLGGVGPRATGLLPDPAGCDGCGDGGCEGGFAAAGCTGGLAPSVPRVRTSREDRPRWRACSRVAACCCAYSSSAVSAVTGQRWRPALPLVADRLSGETDERAGGDMEPPASTGCGWGGWLPSRLWRSARPRCSIGERGSAECSPKAASAVPSASASAACRAASSFSRRSASAASAAALVALGVTRVRATGRLPAALPPEPPADPAAELLPAPRPDAALRAGVRRAAVPAPLLPPARDAPSEFDAAALVPTLGDVAAVPLLLPDCAAAGILLPVPRPCAGVAEAALGAARRGCAAVRLGGPGIARRRDDGTSLLPSAGIGPTMNGHPAPRDLAWPSTTEPKTSFG
jgi:hypothetical protein